MARLVQLLPPPEHDPVFTNLLNSIDEPDLPYIPRRSAWLFNLYDSAFNFSWRRSRIVNLGLALRRWMVLASEFCLRLALTASSIYFGNDVLQAVRELIPVFAVLPFSIAPLLGYLLFCVAFGSLGGLALLGIIPYANFDDRAVAWRHLYYSVVGGPAVGYLIARIVVLSLQQVPIVTTKALFQSVASHPHMLPAIGGILGGLVGLARCYRLIPAYWRWLKQRDRERPDDM
jgi:hypothetical protein